MGRKSCPTFEKEHVRVTGNLNKVKRNHFSVDKANTDAIRCDCMALVSPQFERSDVNKAGAIMLSKGSGYKDRIWALDVINNWRGIHASPLNAVRTTLTDRARKIDPSAIPSQRNKRIPAIILKLRENHKAGMEMKLTQMHDIGGCRVILKDANKVDQLYEVYRAATKKNKLRGGFIRDYDYLTQPKASGYRGVHLVHRYHTDSNVLSVYNGLKIEIQIRSLLQHYWATAVETVDFFTGQALKSNIGELPWKRFFLLASNEIARMEKRPLVPGAPADEMESVEELRGFSLQIKALESFQKAAQAVQIGAESEDSLYYLVELDIEAKTVRARGFNAEQVAEAQQAYLAVEAEQAERPNLQSVLVSVDTLSNLAKAYPSYYLDVTEFVNTLNKILGS